MPQVTIRFIYTSLIKTTLDIIGLKNKRGSYYNTVQEWGPVRGILDKLKFQEL